MSADPISIGSKLDGEPAPSAMPRLLKWVILTAVALAVIGAVAIFVGRGNAFIIDLYNLTGLSFCS